MVDLSRMSERVQSLKEFHRGKEWDRALSRYPDIRRGLIDIRGRYPNLLKADAETLRLAMAQLQHMEGIVETTRDDIRQETLAEFNQNLSEIQMALGELESQLQQSF